MLNRPTGATMTYVDALTTVSGGNGQSSARENAVLSRAVWRLIAMMILALALSFSALFKLIYQRVLNYPDRR